MSKDYSEVVARLRTRARSNAVLDVDLLDIEAAQVIEIVVHERDAAYKIVDGFIKLCERIAPMIEAQAVELDTLRRRLAEKELGQ